MSTKWIKQLDEQKLIDCELADGIVVAVKKNMFDGLDASLELVVLYGEKEYIEANSERENFDLSSLILNIKHQIDKRDESLKESVNSINIPHNTDGVGEDMVYCCWYKVNDDFARTVEVSLSEDNMMVDVEDFKNGFCQLMESFCFQQYYCEKMENFFLDKKEKLEQRSKSMSFQEIRDQKVGEKLKQYAKKIVDFRLLAFEEENAIRAHRIWQQVTQGNSHSNEEKSK